MRIWAYCYSDKPYSMDKHQQGYPVDPRFGYVHSAMRDYI